MRGVVTADMVVALEQLDLVDSFDRVYGCSAGATNGAYLVAGQAALGTTIYYENLNTGEFINPWAWLRGKPVVDLDFLLSEVMTRAKPLDTRRVMASPVALRIVATNADTAEREIISDIDTEDDLLAALTASVTLPVIAGSPRAFKGRRYVDAMLSETVPVPTAEDDGCTHILALATRPRDFVPPKPSWFERAFIAPRLRKESPALASRYNERWQRDEDLFAHLYRHRSPSGRAEVLLVLADGPPVGKFERSRRQLVAGASRGMAAALAELAPGRYVVRETLAAFGPDGHRVVVRD